MTAPDDHGPFDVADGLVAETDPERIEEIAAQMPVDPSPQEVDAYREAIGDEPGPEASGG